MSWTLAQTTIWVCNALGDFATPDEINGIIDDFEHRPGERERLMVEGYARMQSLPAVQAERTETASPFRGLDGNPISMVEIGCSLSARWRDAGRAVQRAVNKRALKVSARRCHDSHLEDISPRDSEHIIFREGNTPYAEIAYDPTSNGWDRFHEPRRWDTVRFDAEAVVKLWPHPASKPAAADPLVRTGAAGRPSAMHLVHEEARRRRECGETLPALKQEAEALHKWYLSRHPEGPALKAKTIENSIRADHRAHRSKKPQN